MHLHFSLRKACRNIVRVWRTIAGKDTTEQVTNENQLEVKKLLRGAFFGLLKKYEYDRLEEFLTRSSFLFSNSQLERILQLRISIKYEHWEGVDPWSDKPAMYGGERIYDGSNLKKLAREMLGRRIVAKYTDLTVLAKNALEAKDWYTRHSRRAGNGAGLHHDRS